jgi:hypothetical protein
VLSALFAGDFDKYFATTGAGKPLWLFVHVPKTAGSSMQAELSAILSPSANIEIDYADTSGRSYQVRFDEAVQKFIETHREKKYRFATGHILARHLDMIREGIPDLRLFSTIRNPVARIVSDYRYQRSNMNVARDAFIASTPDFETYIARPHVHNKTARHLVPKALIDAGDKAGAVKYVMDNFAFIGLQESYPLTLRTLTTLMGNPRTVEAKVRVNSEGDENKVEMTPELEERLRELNNMDVVLFNRFTQQWRGIRESLREYLAKKPKPKAA